MANDAGVDNYTRTTRSGFTFWLSWTFHFVPPLTFPFPLTLTTSVALTKSPISSLTGVESETPSKLKSINMKVTRSNPARQAQFFLAATPTENSNMTTILILVVSSSGWYPGLVKKGCFLSRKFSCASFKIEGPFTILRQMDVGVNCCYSLCLFI